MGIKELQKSLIDISTKVKKRPDMSEGEVSRIFSANRFFESLGYDDIYIRSQERVRKDGKILDFECLDDFEQSMFVLEVKKPSDESSHTLEYYLDKQLRDRYVVPRRSRNGILSNGIKFYLYERHDARLTEVLKIEDLSGVSESETRKIFNVLKKPSYEYTNLGQILEELKRIDPKPLTEEDNREAFYQIFRLKQEESGLSTKFTRLVISLMRLFDELISNGEKSKFLDGAFHFWKQSYAHKPSKVPNSWSRIKIIGKNPNEETLYKFMFCLETAHNIVSKLVIAKVCEDANFKNVSTLKKLEGYMTVRFEESSINLIAYPFAIMKTFTALRSSLVPSLFEDDIFDWWQDCSIRVGKDVDEWRTNPNPEVERFGEAIARLFFALRSFDFKGVREDILGELYQHYFDPETRKALGEFYTPTEVVEYILDAVDYKGSKIINQRLLDPACGSGAFVVAALSRYLHVIENRISRTGTEEQWPIVLRDLCERPKIIGFDINPFARLMAQMRFMMAIIPFYKKAQEIDEDFVLTTIPIFRTDSLEIETKTGMFQHTLDKSVAFSMKMPVIKKETQGEFISVDFTIPSWEQLKSLLHGDKDRYFLLLRLTFEVIKAKARIREYKIVREDLINEFEKKFDGSELFADLFLVHTGRIMDKIKELKEEYGDGRLIKTLEDLVLAGILKNYFLYDYVVGNPPYVRTHFLPEESRLRHRENYVSAHKQYDIYALFIERGIEWLQGEGRFSYIVSSKFTSSDYGIKIREFILNKCEIDELIDVSNFTVFKDAAIYPFIATFTKQSDEVKRKDKMIKVVRKISESDFNDRVMSSYEVPQSRYYKNNEFLFDIHSPEGNEVIELIERNKIPIGSRFNITRGFRPPSKNLVFSKDEAKNSELSLKKFVKGDELVGPYKINRKGNFLHYVKEEIHESKPESVFESPKIMIRDIGLHASAYYDEDELYCLKTIYVILNTPDSPFDLKLLTGILNSELIDFYFKSNFWAAHIGGGYLRFRKQYLERLPTPELQTEYEKNLSEEITELVEKILNLVEKEGNIENFPDSYFDMLVDEIDEWDQINWKPKRNYKDIDIIIEENLDGEKVIVLKNDDKILIGKADSDLKEQYVVMALKGKTAKKDQELILRIPKSDPTVEEILNMLKRDKMTLREEPITTLEEEINDKVYELYGLKKKERIVIKEFLEKF